MKKSLLNVIAGLIVGIYFVIGVWGYSLGLGWSIFCLGLCFIGLYTIKDDIKSSYHGWIIIGGALSLAMSHAIYNQQHFIVLNVIVTIPLLIYGIYILRYGDGEIGNRAINFFYNLDRLFISDKCFEETQKSISLKPGFNGVKGNTWLGIIGGLVLMIILVPLLSAADPVFQNLFSGLGDQLGSIFQDLGKYFNLFKIFIALVIAGLVINFVVNIKNSSKDSIDGLDIDLHISADIYAIMLGFVAALYVLFTIVQIKYLLLGSALPDGLTYSQYAVKGFWQLIAVSLINIGLMLRANHRHKKESVGMGYSIIISIVFVCSMIIWYSSLLRLNLYIETYGLTFMRVLPRSFLLYLIYGLVVSYGGSYYKRPRVKLLVYGVVVWYSLLQLVGIDKIITNYNIKRYINGETKIMDIDYIETLSLDQKLGSHTLKQLNEHMGRSESVENVSPDGNKTSRQEGSLTKYLLKK